jgi:hypothetical protein
MQGAIESLLNLLSTLVTSNIVVALIASAAGAFAGALGAQRIIARNQEYASYLSLLRKSNSAIILSYSAANTLMMLKRQHIQPLCEKYKSDRADCLKALEQSKSKPATGPYYIQADLKTYTLPKLPLRALTQMVYSEIAPNGKGISALAMLEQSDVGFAQVTSRREDLVARFQRNEIPANQFHCHYFGIKDWTGHVFGEYRDLMSAIESYLDDMIFFAGLLTEELQNHAELVEKKLVELNKRRKAPTVNAVDFSSSLSSGLMPEKENYADWLAGFREK